MRHIALSVVVWLLAGCGAVPSGTGTDASAPRTASPPPPTNLASPTTPAGWQTYTDSQFGFSIAYPPGFDFQNEGAGLDSSQSYRTYDPQSASNGYPRGQVEFAIYAKDAASLADWVARHTGPPGGPTANPITYWDKTSNIQSTIAAGRDAIYFEWTTASGPTTVHVIAFFWKSSYVFRLDWWAVDSVYLSAMEATGRQMLDSFQG